MAQDILSSGLLRGADILQASSQHDIQQQKLGLLRSEQTAEEEKRKQDARFKTIDDLANMLPQLVNESDMFDEVLAQWNKLLGEAGVEGFNPGENRKEFAAALAKRDGIPKSQQASYLKMLQSKYGHRKDFAQQTEQLEKDVTREKDLTEKIAEEGRGLEADKALAKYKAGIEGEKRPSPVTWTTATKQVSSRFGKQDPTGNIIITPELAGAHRIAQKHLVKLKQSGAVGPLDAVNKAEEFARHAESRYWEYVEAAQASKTPEINLEKVQNKYKQKYGYLPSIRLR